MDVGIAGGVMKALLKYAGQDLLTFDLSPEDPCHFVIQGSSFDGEPLSFELDAAGGPTGLKLWGLPFDKDAPLPT